MLVVAFLSFGFLEILVVGVVALLVFGGDLPDVMRSLGHSYARLRRSLQDLSRPVRDEIHKIRDLPAAPPPKVGPPASNPPVPEYLEGELTAEEPVADEMTDEALTQVEDPTPPDSTSSGGVADEPPPV